MSLSYADYDYDAIVAQLQGIVAAKSAWQDVYESSTGQMFIEVPAYSGQLMMFNIVRAQQERFILLARLRSSILNNVALLNYKPKRATSAIGNVTFTLSAPLTKNVYIPKYTKLKTASGVKFVTNIDTVIIAGGTSTVVEVLQGQIIERTFASDGTANQSFTINDTAVENSNLFVFVGVQEWEEVSSFVLSQGDSEDFRVLVQLDDTIKIEFGDGKFGKIPLLGSQIKVRYLETDGVDGNIYSLGLVNAIEDTIYDSDGNAVSTITVSNTTLLEGGEDIEDTEEIRYNAPRVFATGDRAVSKADYEAILENYPGIVTANAWGENEENPPNYNEFNRVKLSILLADWQYADINFKTRLCEYLYNYKAQITVRYHFEDPVFCNLIVIDKVKTTRDFTLSTVQSNVEDAIDDKFKLGIGGVRIGSPVRYSDVDSVIDSTDGVSYHFLEFILTQDIGTGNGIQLTFLDTLDLIPVYEGTAQIFNNGVLVAEDDGTGTIVQVGGSGVSGTVVHLTGVISVTFPVAPIKGNIVSVQYKQKYDADEPNDIVPDKNKIVRMVEKRVTVTFAS